MNTQPVEFQEELERLLASPEFSGSRQLHEFMRFTSQRAFEGVSRIDQVEIAEAVLGRGADFNPVEDASVRKLATLARQRLAQFYSRHGSETGVIITLPVRSYVPLFERRVNLAKRSAIAPASYRNRLILIGIAACILTGLASVLVLWKSGQNPSEGNNAPIVMATLRGDTLGPGADAPSEAVRLGSVLHDNDEVSVLLDFTAREEAQQAGILAWEDADHYIQLGRRFMGRNQLVFTLEENGTTLETPQTASYDPDGQSGRPAWLAIRRTGPMFRGFMSVDGQRWVEVGVPLQPSRPFQNVRAGIYALNGRRDAPSTQATFSHLATGATYESWSGSPIDEMGKGGWRRHCSCGSACLSEFEQSALRLSFGPVNTTCDSEWNRPVGPADWEMTTKLDHFPAPGIAAGLGVSGTKGSVRLVRYFLNGPAISLIYDTKTLVGVPDFNGSPALFLRLRCREGLLTGSYSLDGNAFHQLSPEVHVNELGGDLHAGLRLRAKGFSSEAGVSPVRFLFCRESVTRLAPYR